MIMRSYLEHEAQPKAVLREACRVLSPGGILVVKVPNYGSINRNIFGKQWCGFRYPDHLNYFTADSLRAMLINTGFEILRCRLRDRLPTSDNMWMLAVKPLAS